MLLLIGSQEAHLRPPLPPTAWDWLGCHHSAHLPQAPSYSPQGTPRPFLPPPKSPSTCSAQCVEQERLQSAPPPVREVVKQAKDHLEYGCQPQPSWLLVRGWPGCCTVFSSIPGLCPLEASTASTSSNNPKYLDCQRSPGDKSPQLRAAEHCRYL